MWSGGTAENNPDIVPGIVQICIINMLGVRLYQKSFSGSHFMRGWSTGRLIRSLNRRFLYIMSHGTVALATDNIMKNIFVSDKWSKGI
jgi:hypothetical protein